MVPVKRKILVGKQMVETTVSRWVQPISFDLAVVTIGCSLYDVALNVAIGKWSEFQKYLKFAFDEECERDEPRALYKWFKNKKDNNRSTNFIFLPSLKWSADDYATLCHELHHFSFISLTSYGLTHTQDSEQAFAYFQGYFMERVIKAGVMLEKSRKKKR